VILFLVSLNTLVSCVALFYVWRAARSQRRLIEMWMAARQEDFRQLALTASTIREEVRDLRHTQRTGDDSFGATLSKLHRLIRRPDPPTMDLGPPAPTAHERLMKDDD
jgi:hypothetical protein